MKIESNCVITSQSRALGTSKSSPDQKAVLFLVTTLERIALEGCGKEAHRKYGYFFGGLPVKSVQLEKNARSYPNAREWHRSCVAPSSAKSAVFKRF